MTNFKIIVISKNCLKSNDDKKFLKLKHQKNFKIKLRSQSVE